MFTDQLNGASTVPDSPVIVIGMHRSGTTLLSRLLTDMGVHMGADTTTANAESLFFLNLNNSVLRQASATWFTPLPFADVVDHKDCQSRYCTHLIEQLNSSSFSQFEGDEFHAGNYRWGWKDPRSTITLPLWLKIFPQAKVIHIVRNGVGVANSLVERDRRTFPRTLRSRVRRAARCVYPLPPGSRSTPFRSLQEPFDLWSHYLSLASRFTERLSSEQLLTFRFEDLAARAVSVLSQIGDFLDLQHDEEFMQKLASTIQTDKVFAWTQNPQLTEFHDLCRESPLMQRFGYDTPACQTGQAASSKLRTRVRTGCDPAGAPT